MVLGLISGCTNLDQNFRGLANSGDPAIVADSTIYTHLLQNVDISSASSVSGGAPRRDLKLAVNTGASGFTPLTTYCDPDETKPCACEIRFTETNTVGGQNTSVERTKRFPVAEVQTGLVRCSMDDAFWQEIPTGTSTFINIVMISPNLSGLNVRRVTYRKGTVTTANGDFLDDTLTPFRNIHRYSCHSKWTNSFEILNQYSTSTDASNRSATALIGSAFCSGETSSGSANPANTCATPRNGYSAQSYFRNLYIRSDKLGEINSRNEYYDCPKVLESISYSAGAAIPEAERNKYWPLDTSFALATQYSSEWSVGVRAASILHKDNDPDSAEDTCLNEDTSQRLNEILGGKPKISTKCIGYAKRPKPDGTCGQIADANGRVRPLVRLRRYRVIYPPVFRPNGRVSSAGPEADEVYVADRLVLGPTGVPTGAMIYGPKPCQFAWFDHEGVTNRTGTVDFGSNLQRSSGAVLFATPQYVATNNYRNALLGSVNPDGLVFPKYDRDGAFSGRLPPFCSATLPVVEELLGRPSSIRLVTSHQDRTDTLTVGGRTFNLAEVPVKPIDAWTPNYIEDTSFQACAPVADPYLEPPLHFYKLDSDTMGWCTKNYPTQNPYWLDLNSRKRPVDATLTGIAVGWPGVGTAPVEISTSHVDGAGLLDAQNTCTGTSRNAVCTMTLEGTSLSGSIAACSTYLQDPGATCDRTVVFDPTLEYRGFPLQARSSEIETMLSQDLAKDRTYSCQFSVHPDSNKVGKKMPLSGCCGIVGGTPVLNPLLVGGAGSAGHLEPFRNPAVPSIRFCGSPVDIP